jgi:hypothetical protein
MCAHECPELLNCHSELTDSSCGNGSPTPLCACEFDRNGNIVQISMVHPRVICPGMRVIQEVHTAYYCTNGPHVTRAVD